MKEKEITKNNKLIAEFMGLVYVPWNNLQGYSHPGWWRDIDNLPYISDGVRKLRQTYCKDATSKIGKSYLQCRTSKELKYDTSWDWLQKVVRKVGTLQENFGAYQHRGFINNLTLFSSKEDIYKGVVDYIKWYNER